MGMNTGGLEEVQDRQDRPSDVSDDSDDDSAPYSSSESEPELSLTDLRTRNLKRNKELLERLGLKHGCLPHQAKRRAPAKRKDAQSHREGDEGRAQRSRGMLLPTEADADAHVKRAHDGAVASEEPHRAVDRLYATFPHRDAQIRRLLVTFSTTLSAVDESRPSSGASTPSTSSGRTFATDRPPYVPDPGFVVGPSGTGKSVVVRGILEALLSDRPCATSAVMNCDVLDSESVEEFTRTILGVFQDQVRSDHQSNAGLRK